MVAYGLIHEGDKLLRGFVYLARQPAFNDARRGEHVEMRHHFHIRIAAGRIQHADILTKLLDSAVDDGIYIRFKKALEAVAPDGAQRAQADGPVFVKILEKLQEPVLPQQRSLMAAQKRNGLLLKHPAHEVVHVLKMIIEVLAADPSKLGYVADGYLIKRLLSHESFKRLGQRVLGLVGCGVRLSFHCAAPLAGGFIYTYIRATRHVVPVVFIVIAGLGWYFSGNCPYAYGYSSLTTPKLNESQIADNMVADNFTSSNMLALVVPAGDYE